MSYHEIRIMTTPDATTQGALVERLDAFTIPLFARHGVVTRGVWTADGGPEGHAGPDLSVYHWLEHDSVESAGAAWPLIREESARTAREHLDVTMSSLPLDPIPTLTCDIPAELAVVPSEGPGGTHLYELRLYSPLPGHAGQLIERFEQFTRGLFDAHGLANVVYLGEHDPATAPAAPGAVAVPNPAGGRGAEPRLAFILAHPSKAAAITTWERVARSKSSIPDDGKPVSLLSGKTISYLRPTPYSPLR